MPDARLQQLERAWKTSGALEDEAAYLRELVRRGELSEEEFALRSWTQDLEGKLELLRESLDDVVWVKQADGSERLWAVVEVLELHVEGEVLYEVRGAYPLSRWRLLGVTACWVLGFAAILGWSVGLWLAVQGTVGVGAAFALLLVLPAVCVVGTRIGDPALARALCVEELQGVRRTGRPRRRRRERGPVDLTGIRGLAVRALGAGLALVAASPWPTYARQLWASWGDWDWIQVVVSASVSMPCLVVVLEGSARALNPRWSVFWPLISGAFVHAPPE